MSTQIERPICSVAGCNQQGALNRKSGEKAYYRSKCTRHHRKQYGMASYRSGSLGEEKKGIRLTLKPCMICGWDEGPTDTHRLQPAKGYTRTNCVPLCPNCHRLVTVGLLELGAYRGEEF